jgi:hypothetical protein
MITSDVDDLVRILDRFSVINYIERKLGITTARRDRSAPLRVWDDLDPRVQAKLRLSVSAYKALLDKAYTVTQKVLEPGLLDPGGRKASDDFNHTFRAL